jgi:hypothetical protein
LDDRWNRHRRRRNHNRWNDNRRWHIFLSADDGAWGRWILSRFTIQTRRHM